MHGLDSPAKTNTRLVVTGGVQEVPPSVGDNEEIAGRRYSLLLYFKGECGHACCLEIRQHKGPMYMSCYSAELTDDILE